MEAITLRAVAGEVESLCVPSRVAGVGQSTAIDIFLTLRRGGEHYLVLSARPEAPSFHLAGSRPGRLPSPTAFCRLLRKRLGGLILTGVGRRGLERAVDLYFAGAAGDPPLCRLAVEIMGRWSNIVLVEEPSGVIIDSLQHVPEGVSRLRAVLPGEDYLPPPRGGRLDPTEMTRPEFVAACRGAVGEGRSPQDAFVGLGPGMRALAARAGEGDDPCGALYDGIGRIVALVDEGRTSPVLYRSIALPLAPEEDGGEGEVFASVSAAAGSVFAETAGESDRQGLERAVRRDLARRRKRLRKSLRRIEGEADGAAEEARLQEAAGAILTSLRTIPRGASAFRWTDAAGAEQAVDLNPALSPRRNAELLYKKVRKVRRRTKMARDKLPAARDELERTELLISGLGELTLRELRNMAARGPAKGRGKVKGPAARRPPVREYRRGEWRILVGKSSRGNDELTTRLARAEDVWLHTRDFAGAHVVIKGDGEPPDEIVRAAGEAAAWHSAGKEESSVDVAWTKRKHVRKVKGQAPGQVLVSRSKTIRVRPRVPEGFDEVRPDVIE